MAHTIACLNPKGGSGKTTLVTNIARAFQEYGQVIILDTDPQQTAGEWAERSPDDYPAVAYVKGVVLEKQVPKFKAMFDFVFIDGAASLGEVIADAMKSADLVLIPVQPSLPDIWATSDLVEAIKMRQSITDGVPDAAFVISRQGVGTRLAAGVELPLQQFGLRVLDGRTANRVAYAEAISGGVSVLDYAPRSKAAQEIKDIAAEVRGLIYATV